MAAVGPWRPMTEVEYEVTGTAGQEIGVFRLPGEARCIDLKQCIERSYRTPIAAQEIMIGHQLLRDEDYLSVDPLETEQRVATTLLLKFPEPPSKVEVKWQIIPDTSNFLEELDVNIIECEDSWVTQDGFQKKFACAGIDPNSGLLVAMHATDMFLFSGKGKGKGAFQTSPDWPQRESEEWLGWPEDPEILPDSGVSVLRYSWFCLCQKLNQFGISVMHHMQD